MNLVPTTVSIIEILLILAAILFHKVTHRSQPNSTTRNRANGDARLCVGAGSVNIAQYRLRDLEKATDNFSDCNMLGKGGFGEVYKGRIDGEIVAIKLLHGSSVKLLEDIAKEVSLLSSLNNNNIVKLLGFCSEAGRYLLVYEYISNGDLRGCLADNKRCETVNWEKRFKIIEGIARGLSYLHHNSENVVIHHDLKPENILLDEHYTPKIADFGLSKVFETKKTHKSTRKLAGTLGYFAPELWFQWQYSTRSDVYSYGLIVLEILAGCTIPHYAQANQGTLSHVMWKQWKDKRPFAEVIDSSLREECAFNLEQIARCCVIGLLCVQHDPKRRPDMELVLQMLHNNIDLPTPSFPGFFQAASSFELQPSEDARPCSFELQPSEDARSSSSKLPPLIITEYSLKDLKVVTHNFSFQLCSTVDCHRYKGSLDGQTVAVEEYSHLEDSLNLLMTPVLIERKRKFKFLFVGEKIIKRKSLHLRHPNITNILGYCLEVEGKLFIIYAYPTNGYLIDYLSGWNLAPTYSEWRTRVKIIKGIATGMSYLHHGLQKNSLIYCGNLNPSQIMLDDSWDAKLCGLGLAIIVDKNQGCFKARPLISTDYLLRPIAPEAASSGLHSIKSDVYNYGVILLQILVNKEVHLGNLLYEVRKYWQQEEREMRQFLDRLLDRSLQNHCPEEEALRFFQIALLCSQNEPERRPSMQQVLEMLNSLDPLPMPSIPP